MGKYRGGTILRGDVDHGHDGLTLQGWMQLPEVTDVGLSVAEFVAVCFYTSSSHRQISHPLRSVVVPRQWAMFVYF